MENKEMMRLEEAAKLAKDIKNKYEVDKLADMVKNNYIDFSFEGHDYRVMKLDQKEKDDLDRLRREKYSSLLQEKDSKGNFIYLTQKEMIRIYKERGIADFDELNNRIKKLETEIKDLQLKLGEELTKDNPEEILKTYKNKITVLAEEIDAIERQKTDLLINSFEKTLEDYVMKILAYLSLKIKEGENYSKTFENIEDFLKSSDELIGKSIAYSMAIHYL